MKKIVSAVIIGGLMFIQVFMSEDTAQCLDEEINLAIEQNAKDFGVESSLIRAIIKKESNNYVFSFRSDKKALMKQAWFMNAMDAHRLDKTYYKNYCSIGLMQILFLVAHDLGFRASHDELFKPDINIMYGTIFLKSLQIRFKNIKDVISAYNNGGAYFIDTDGDKAHDEEEPYRNQAYVDEVYANYKSFGGIQ